MLKLQDRQKEQNPDIKFSGNISFHSGQAIFLKDIICPRFQLQNRRYLGNKYKLINLIEDIVTEKCKGFKSICDIFAGTGVVGGHFNSEKTKIISNDILKSKYVPLKTFLCSINLDLDQLSRKIDFLNKLKTTKDNY